MARAHADSLTATEDSTGAGFGVSTGGGGCSGSTIGGTSSPGAGGSSSAGAAGPPGSARSAFTRPPATEGRPPAASTVPISALLTCAAVSVGSSATSRAAAAATCGLAIDVPPMYAYPLFL